MYREGTILELKEPRSTESDPFPYDQVEVIGISPVTHAGGASDWDGVNAQGVIVRPLTEFGATIDEPYGKLRALYSIIEEPGEDEDGKVVAAVSVVNALRGDSPEDVFAAIAAETPPVPAPKTKPSPLADVASSD